MGKSSSSATADSYFVDIGSTSGSFNKSETITDVSTQRVSIEQLKQSATRKSHSIENAVYGHIRALRALGRKRINTDEIADALSLPMADVNQAIAVLRNRGVKLIR
jgi:hypothetical protein